MTRPGIEPGPPRATVGNGSKITEGHIASEKIEISKKKENEFVFLHANR
jgi:hypothetical protein